MPGAKRRQDSFEQRTFKTSSVGSPDSVFALSTTAGLPQSGHPSSVSLVGASATWGTSVVTEEGNSSLMMIAFPYGFRNKTTSCDLLPHGAVQPDMKETGPVAGFCATTSPSRQTAEPPIRIHEYRIGEMNLAVLSLFQGCPSSGRCFAPYCFPRHRVVGAPCPPVGRSDAHVPICRVSHDSSSRIDPVCHGDLESPGRSW